MANPRKVNVVDSYTTLAAARRAVGKTTKKGRKSAATKEEAPEPAAGKKRKPQSGGKQAFARTTLPTKHEIQCYECGFVFSLAGKSARTACPKCRVVLDRKDVVVDASWNEEIKTVGLVHIRAEGVVEGGVLAANDIVLEGRVAGGRVQAFRKLELRPGAAFEEDHLKARDILVCEGACFVFAKKAFFRHLEVRGELEGVFYAEGVVTVGATGVLKGELHGAHLVVEEGGALDAAVYVESVSVPGSTGGPENQRKE